MATNYCNSDDRKLAQFTLLLLGSGNEVAARESRAVPNENKMSSSSAEIGTVISSETGHRASDYWFYQYRNMNRKMEITGEPRKKARTPSTWYFS